MAKGRSGVDRGRLQPDSVGRPGKVMSHQFKPGADDGPNTKRSKAARINKTSLKVNSYPKQFQAAVRAIHRSIGKGR